MKKHFSLLLICLSLVSFFALASPPDEKEKPKDPMASETFSGLKFRSIGPALMSGRISSIAVNPNDYSNYYIGAASSGVWKTTNAGTTFSPIFDCEGSFSI